MKNKKGIKKIIGKLVFIVTYVVGLNVLQASNVFAAENPLSVIENLSTFIYGLIRAVGMIILAFGVVQIGMSLKSHDPSQRAQGFWALAGGVVVTFTKEIINLITGG